MMKPKLLTFAELDAIKMRAEAATPEPWKEEWESDAIYEDDPLTFWPYQIVTETLVVCGFDDSQPTPDDFTFIAHARADIPALLAYIDTLKKKLNHAGQWIANADVVLEPGWEGSRDSILREIEEALGWHEDDVDFDIRFNRPGLTGGKE